MRQRYRLIVSLILSTVIAGCSQDKAEPLPPGMVLIPAGDFVMGSDEVDNDGKQQEFGFRQPMFLDEHPRHPVFVDAFYIDQFEVSSGAYKQYVLHTGVKEPEPWVQNGYNVHEQKLQLFDLEMLRKVATDYFQLDMDTTKMERSELLTELNKIQQQRDRLPVNAVSWYDAASYCKWIGKRLPTEAEWEKAARGPQGYRYPWGDDWDPSQANTGQGESVLVASGSVATDRSGYGISDMGGNVSEWVADWYEAYPGAEFQSDYYGGIHKIIKGGGAGVGHYALSYFFRSTRRGQADPSAMSVDVGFRCALSAGAQH